MAGVTVTGASSASTSAVAAANSSFSRSRSASTSRYSREEIAARYEFCEDLATLLVDHTSTRLGDLGVTQADVLARTHRGLIAGDATVTPAQAEWVIRRLAELLGWDAGSFDAASA